MCTVPSQRPRRLSAHQRQRIILRNNYVEPESAIQKTKPLDDFFLYTSVSGLRFLHSRNPTWFQIVSGLALLLSMLMSVYHSWTFIRKYIQPTSAAQITAAYYADVTFPRLIVCPYKRFKMLDSNYTNDFSFIVTNLWNAPNKEPVVGEKQLLIEFLNNTIDTIANFSAQPSFNDKVVADLNSWISTIARILPQVATMGNVSNAIRVLHDNFQWTNYQNYRERMLQNDSCYQNRFKVSVKELYLCRLRVMRDLVTSTVANYHKLLVRIKAPPNVDEYMLQCNYWTGDKCEYKIIDSVLGIKCIQIETKEPVKIQPLMSYMTTNFVLDTQAFNNQVTGWETDEIRVMLLDKDEMLQLNTSNFFLAGGGLSIDLEINALIDLYYRGTCFGQVDRNVYAFASSQGAHEESCRNRQYSVDYTTSPIQSGDYQELYGSKLRFKREQQFVEIDNIIQAQGIYAIYAPELSQQFQKEFEDFFNDLVFLARILQSSDIIQNLEPFPVRKQCKTADFLRQARARFEQTVQHVYSLENNTTDKVLTVGLAYNLKHFPSVLVTKLVRYYSNRTNLDNLGKSLNTLYKITADLRNNLTQGGVCEELLVHVKMFIQNSIIVQRTFFDNRQSLMEYRLKKLIKRRDARLIYNDYPSQNFMSVQLRYRRLYSTIISRTEGYNTFRLIGESFHSLSRWTTLDEWLADIGSSMSLYFGLSVLTIYEFGVFMFVKNAADGSAPVPSQTELYKGDVLETSKQQLDPVDLNVPPLPS